MSSLIGTERRPDGSVELHLTGGAGSVVGLALAALTTLPVVALASTEAALQFLAVELGFIGAIYFGFGVADGRVRPLLVEGNVAIAFLAVGTVSLWAGQPWLLAAGYVAHALWDLIHHPGGASGAGLTPVRNWYPPFCVAYDLFVAAAIAVWLT